MGKHKTKSQQTTVRIATWNVNRISDDLKPDMSDLPQRMIDVIFFQPQNATWTLHATVMRDQSLSYKSGQMKT